MGLGLGDESTVHGLVGSGRGRAFGVLVYEWAIFFQHALTTLSAAHVSVCVIVLSTQIAQIESQRTRYACRHLRFVVPHHHRQGRARAYGVCGTRCQSGPTRVRSPSGQKYRLA